MSGRYVWLSSDYFVGWQAHESCNQSRGCFAVDDKLNIYSIVRKRKPYKKATQFATYHHYENVLNRDFQATRPNQKWITNVTYILTQQSWSYLHCQGYV